jgi:hypothetical protein
MINLEELSQIYLLTSDDFCDVTDLVTVIDIYQSIYDPVVTGNITFMDSPSARVSKLFKDAVVGKGEQVSFGLKTRTQPASKDNTLIFENYYIYKVQVFPLESTGTDGMFKQAVNVSFCSESMFLNEMRKVKEFYFDTISNIVNKIGTNYLNISKMDIEQTTDKQFIQIPNLSPLKAITWLTSRAYASPANKDKVNTDIKTDKNTKEKINNNFVFYEDIDHNYHFVSIGSMLAKTPILGVQDTDGIRIETAPSDSTTGKVTYRGSYAAIQHIGKAICPLSNLKNGMYSSTCLTFDLTRKKYSKNVLKYKDIFDTQDHLYPEQIINPDEKSMIAMSYETPEAVIKYYPKSSYLYNPNENLINSDNPTNNAHKWVLQRTSSMEAMDQVGLDVEIKGNVGIQLGDVVHFSRPQLDYSTDPSTSGFDPLFTGKFLITKIKHTLENRGGNFGFNLRTSLSLRRDSKYIPSATLGV